MGRDRQAGEQGPTALRPWSWLWLASVRCAGINSWAASDASRLPLQICFAGQPFLPLILADKVAYFLTATDISRGAFPEAPWAWAKCVGSRSGRTPKSSRAERSTGNSR